MRWILFVAPFALLLAQSHPPVIENDSVRVLAVTDEPAAQPGPEHEHKQSRVMVYLDSGDIQIRHADGKTETQHWKPGDVAWSPADGLHTSQNVSPRSIRIIEIELKNTGNSNEEGAPDRTRAIVDNAQVRVYQAAKAPPAGKNYVAVDIKTGQALWDKMPEGSGPFVIAEIK